ncbi:TPA: TrkH family potassium uptake protein [Methanosarcina acetivorans]|uniref:Sodium transport protein n=2 Tax=Methanosarcina acetivorans TaxID=2214 RepID=Q8TQQ9_METAC|nr:TrkH family potassium uptake protein [Methanosarcina acetivorans]AAM04895.1 sodium transport protein [Methanosarcina acetivorans C2A]HIH94174.1 TrkH family potassium uptake protein [Methanosarcina acetivorans]
MNDKAIFNALGKILVLLAFTMLVPLFVALYYREPLEPFLVSTLVTFLAGLILARINENADWQQKEALAIVALSWLAAAIFGAIPFLFEGISFLDAVFETMSGFTSTGSTILVNIESYSRSLLFWRSFTQWLGGMGIIVLFIAILPKLGVAGRQLFRAEAPGPTEDKLKPRIKDTAKILWALYVLISALEVLALMLAGISLYDSLTHTFACMACGGFSSYGAGIEAFGSPLIEFILTFFMFAAGANFALYYRAVRIDKNLLFRDEEFRAYASFLLGFTGLLTLVLYKDMGLSLFNSIRYASFQITSVMTATGFASVDFNRWKDSAKVLVLAVMFIGGCAGSTGGGMKVVRFLLMLKYARRELFKFIHPKVVRPIRFNGRAVSDDVLQSILSFVVIYISVFVFSSMLLTLLGVELISSITASITTLGNIGPGFNLFGPMENFESLLPLGKIILITNMWIGRLELYTVLVLFTSDFWHS